MLTSSSPPLRFRTEKPPPKVAVARLPDTRNDDGNDSDDKDVTELRTGRRGADAGKGAGTGTGAGIYAGVDSEQRSDFLGSDLGLDLVLPSSATPRKASASAASRDLSRAIMGTGAGEITRRNFLMEQRIFLKAMLDLVAERDTNATEVGMNDPNMIKSGPLKKSSHLVSGVWKVKFVEVRRGMFSYYEDVISSEKSGGLLRKNIPLDYNTCSCRAVKVHRQGLNATSSGAIFELKVGGTGRLWLAKSRSERQAWIQAINDAMVGGSVTRGEPTVEHHGRIFPINSKSPYKSDLKKYLKIRSELKNAASKADYVSPLRELHSSSIDIPVQWIVEHANGSKKSNQQAFKEQSVSESVEQLWKDLKRDTIRINDELFLGGGEHAPERIFCGLVRHIITTSRLDPHGNRLKSSVPEARAFAFARDVLLSGNRTRSGGDSYFCVDTMVNNPEQVVTVPSSREAEPLEITVGPDDEESSPGTKTYAHDKSGWIWTRNRIQRKWRKRYFVLSEGTMSFYRNAAPRPHGLRWQLAIKDIALSVDRSKTDPNYMILFISSKDDLKDRYLRFTNEDKLFAWIYALECTARDFSSARPGGLGVLLKRISPRDSDKQQQENSKPTDKDLIVESMEAHMVRLGLPKDGIESRVERLASKVQTSRVRIDVSASTEYNITTTNPQGDETDTWATIQATFQQTFRIVGERIARGEETVRLTVTQCDGVDLAQSSFGEKQPSSPNNKKRVGQRGRSRTLG